MIKYILFVTILVSSGAHAAARRRPASDPTAEAVTTSAGATTHRSVRQPNWGYSVGLVSWQEKIKIQSGGNSGNLLTQSTGISLNAVYEIPRRSARWLYGYSGALQLGALKGAGTTTDITDTFKDNRWYALQGAVNLTYRTTSVSAVRFEVPVTYRMIAWELGADSTSKPDRRAGISLGYGGVYINNFNARSALLVGFTHQQLWDATQWSIAFRRLFR